jgi:hypothetical protein
VTDQDEPRTLTATAKVVLVVMGGLLVAGAFRVGDLSEAWGRLWADLVERRGGPMSFRFVLQPLMAAIAAATDGIRDAKTGRSPYFWTVLRSPAERNARLSEGLVSTARLILIAIAVDAIYQLKVFRTFYPVQALLCALMLAFVPYLLLRGPVARVASRWRSRKASA